VRKIVLFFLISTSYIFAIDYTTIPDDELVELAKDGDVEAQYSLAILLDQLKYEKNSQRLDYLERDSFKWYELAAQNGHPKSITKVALEYLSEFGQYKVKDYKKCINLLTQSAAEDREAALYLSIMYYFGLGVEKNSQSSLEYLIQSQKNFYRLRPLIYLEKELISMVRDLVKQENPYALFILGDFYYYGKTGAYSQDYKKAYRVYRKAADLGNVSAIYMVGLMNYNGIGILKDLHEAYNWIIKAAENNIIDAISKAGIMNYFGEGTVINYKLAHSLFLKASEGGESLSQYFLGVMYYKGEGCQKDRDLSRKWIKEAYLNGSTSAKKFWETKELWK